MKRSILTIIAAWLVVMHGQSQDFILYNDQKSEPTQHMVMVYGQILDASSNQPVKGHINFEKMPRANNVGIISNNESGAYKLHMLDQKRYTLEITAEGYITVFDVVDISDLDADGQMKRDYLLTRAEEGNVLRMSNLLFELGKAQILETSYDELNSLAQMLHNNSKMKIQLEGHTDYRGNPDRNMKLSQQRVLAVKDYLVAQNIKRNRIKLKAFGGTHPITTENTEEARLKNRRVEVRILSK